MVSKENEKIRFTFRIPEELYTELKDESTKLGVSVNALILQILWDWEKEKQRQAK